jgi:hypothetical protein
MRLPSTLGLDGPVVWRTPSPYLETAESLRDTAWDAAWAALAVSERLPYGRRECQYSSLQVGRMGRISHSLSLDLHFLTCG